MIVWIPAITLGLAALIQRREEKRQDRGPDGEYGAVASWMGGRGPTSTGVAGWMGGRMRTGTYASGIEDAMLDEDRYGAVFAIPIAIEALLLAGLAATAATAWVVTDKQALAEAIKEAWGNAAAWATGSAAIAASYQAARQIAYAENATAVATAAAAGIRIPDNCAWILSPYLIFDRVVAASRPKLLETFSEAEIIAAADKARKVWFLGNGPLVQLIRKLLEGTIASTQFASMAFSLVGGMITLFFSAFGAVNMMYLFDGIMAGIISDIEACAGRITPGIGRKAKAAFSAVLSYLKSFKLVLFALRAMRMSRPFVAILKAAPIPVAIAAVTAMMMSLLALLGVVDKEDADDIWEMIGPFLENHGITREMLEDMLPGEDSEETRAFRDMFEDALADRIDEGEEGAVVLARGKAQALIGQARADGTLSEWSSEIEQGSAGGETEVALIPTSGDALFEEGPIPEGYYNVANYLPGDDQPTVLPSYRSFDPEMGDLAQKHGGPYSTTTPTMVRLRQGLDHLYGIYTLPADPMVHQGTWTSTRRGVESDMVLCGGGTTGMPEYWDTRYDQRNDQGVECLLSHELMESSKDPPTFVLSAKNVPGVSAGTSFTAPCNIQPGTYDVYVDGDHEWTQRFGHKGDKGCPIYFSHRG